MNVYDINTKVFVIQGQAGTGKTTMLRNALADIIGNETQLSFESVKNIKDADMFNPNGSLGCIGVTVAHKAKKVLNKSIPICATFASYFGLIMSIDDYGNKTFVPNPNPLTHKNALFRKTHKVAVHDEVSMYDLDMINHTIMNTPFETKIIFVGDPGQLPPINENEENPTDEDSPAFYLFQNKIILDQKVRQTEGNPIIELTDYIYENIFNPYGVSQHQLNNVLKRMLIPKFNDGVGYDVLSYDKFLSVYTNITRDFTDSKIIAYRNGNVDFYNDTVRNFIYNNPQNKIIQGELIYMNDTFSLDRKTTFYNSDEYIIQKENIFVHEGVECHQAFVDGSKYSHLNLSQNCYMLIPTFTGQLELNRLMIYFNRCIEDTQPRTQERKIAYAKKYKFLEKFAKVSYGYCYTSHKAQGSTFKNVFVDVNDIITVNISPKRKLQALYTAITRASHSVYFLN